MIGKLAWVGLAVTDVAGAARVLADDFELARTDCAVGTSGKSAPVFALGEAALALFAPDDPFLGGPARPGVHHIALAVSDVETAVRACAEAGVPAAAPMPGFSGRWLRALRREQTAGVLTYLSEPLELPRAGGGPVERIDHIGVASADNTEAVDVFSRRLGFTVESTQTDLEVRIAVESFTSDKYGAVYHSRPPEPVGGLHVAFITVGDCELEFLQDFDSRHAATVAYGQPGTTKQDQGAIARFVTARGAGLHHLAIKVRDIDGLLGTLARAGHAVIDRVGRPGSRRARIGFLHPKSLHGVLVHLVERAAA